MNEIIEQKLKNLPESPGVYIMKDVEDNVIYVGKSVNLKSRVSQYFHNSDHPPKTRAMVSNVNNFEIINTDSEVEALILECKLIKKHRPHYNVILKDDKMYPYIRITAEQYPRICMMRRPINDGSKYFGPYTSANAMNQTLKLLRKIFPIRSCKHFHKRPCLEYHIHRCLAPCVNHVDQKDYFDLVHSVELFLKGQTKQLESTLSDKMQMAADNFNFELAARFRNQLFSVKNLAEMQKEHSKNNYHKQ